MTNEREEESKESPQSPYKYVVALGNNHRFFERLPYGREGVLNLESKIVACAAAELLLSGRTERILFSTGVTSKDKHSEARSMKDFVLEQFSEELKGKEHLIELEESSYDTRTNAKESGKILEGKDIPHVGLITPGYHLDRASKLFARYRIATDAQGAEEVLTGAKNGSSGAQERYHRVYESLLNERINEKNSPLLQLEEQREKLLRKLTALHLDPLLSLVTRVRRVTFPREEH